jgi:hypothetical protein
MQSHLRCTSCTFSITVVDELAAQWLQNPGHIVGHLLPVALRTLATGLPLSAQP